jgi:hypothetical protein
MRVVVFGASGRTARHVVAQALLRGHRPVAMSGSARSILTSLTLDALENDEWIGHVVGVSAIPTN